MRGRDLLSVPPLDAQRARLIDRLVGGNGAVVDDDNAPFRGCSLVDTENVKRRAVLKKVAKTLEEAGLLKEADSLRASAVMYAA
jgi:hypothetical protein